MSLLLRRLWVQMTADRKRFAALCVMLVIGLLLWSRIILINNTPRTAIADPNEDTNLAGPGPERLGPARSSPGSYNPSPEAIEVQLAAAPRRDPFRISPQHFPKPTTGPANPKQAGKSGPPVADDPESLAQLSAVRLQALADQFVLEAVMHGRPMAVINGRVYRLHEAIPAVGDEAVSFTLTHVERTSVTLECKGQEFVLKLSTPTIKQ